jgi:Sporulation related domain.
VGDLKHVFCWSAASLALLSLVGCSSLTGTSNVLSNAELQNHVAAHATEINTIKPQMEELEREQALLKEDLVDLEQKIAKLQRSPVVQSASDTTKKAGMKASPEEEVYSSRSEPVVADFKSGRNASGKGMSTKVTSMSSNQYSGQFYGVQLAAYASKSLAMKGWQKISRANPIDYVDTAPLIKRHTIKGKVYYQLKVGPFVERSYSVDFCNMLKQQRAQTCLITRYDGEPFLSP